MLGTVIWQATVAVLVPIVVGVLLGIAAGRWGWSAFARDIGVIDLPVVPVLAVGAVVLAAVTLVNVVALAPAAVAARTPAGAVLRARA